MEKIFAIKQPPGGMSIMKVIDDSDMDKVIKDFNAVSKFQITLDDLIEITEADIPTDRYFRNAWKYCDNSQKITHDIEKAKDIHLNILREMRTPLLNKLDVEYQKADESNDFAKKAEIVAKKQALRDVTKIELPDNLEEIKNTIPEILR